MSNGYYLSNRSRNNSYPLDNTFKYSIVSNCRLSIPKVILKYTRIELIIYYKIVINVCDREYVRIYRFNELCKIWNKLKLFLDIVSLEPFNIFTLIQKTNSSFELVKNRRLMLEKKLNDIINKNFNIVFNHFFIINEPTYKRNKFHNRVRITQTYWMLDNSNIFLIEVPWGIQSHTTENVCEIDTVRNESIKMIKKRYDEFNYIIKWALNQKDIAEGKLLLSEISKYRKRKLEDNICYNLPEKNNYVCDIKIIITPPSNVFENIKNII